ncbi:hypothetical protein [Pantoea sp. UBA4549]|uniref:hypothetical protein n=1 Tax=Pantoea sp. UBA4549 TaxID=1947033 RepID=UPI0025F68892|nr:hypothetical protein [Pantoea sp. UBA4549]
MTLLLCYIHVSNFPSKGFDIVTSAHSVKDKAMKYETLIKEISNFGPELKKDARIMREISAVKDEKKVSQQLSVNNELKGTGNYSPAAAASRHEPVPLSPIAVAMPKAAARQSVASSKADALDKPVTHPASSVLTSSPARSQAEVKPEPAAIHNKKSSAPENQPSLLSRIKSQSAKSWISLKNYISSLKNAYRQQQSEKSAKFENTARTKSEGCGTMIELTNAYDNSPFTALFLYNAAKQELIFNAINDIITQAGKENKEIDLRKLCDQANRYAVNSGAKAKFFTLSKNNTIEHNIKYGVPTMQQRVSRVEEDIGSKNETSATLRRNSQSLSGRQRANSVQSITRRMVDDAYSKLFNDIQNDKDKIFGTRHSFDQNEMCAALLEGQPELAGLRRSAT